MADLLPWSVTGSGSVISALLADRTVAVASGLISIPSINFSDFFLAVRLLLRFAFDLAEVCAVADMVVPEKMPKATETKSKCFIRKIGVLYVSTT